MSAQSLPLEVSCREVQELRENGDAFLFLDCRERDEHEFVRIEGTTFVPMSEMMVRAEELRTHMNRRIVVHCHHGGRSLQVANWLRGQGFDQAQSMAGGIDDWAATIDPSLTRY